MKQLMLAVILATIASFANAGECSIVYGSDWAFLSNTPEGWVSACGNSAMSGTNITLWPANQTSNNAEPIIYVTVSGRDFPTLEKFAADEQGRFKRESPSLKITRVEENAPDKKPTYMLFRLSGASGNREEMAAYFEGKTAYFIVVITSASSATLEKNKAVFLKYISSFQPMVKK